MGLRGVNSAKLELYSQSFFPCTVPRRHGSLETFYTTSGRHSEEASTCFFFFVTLKIGAGAPGAEQHAVT